MSDHEDSKDLWEKGSVSQSNKYYGSDSALSMVEKLMAKLQAELDELHKDAQHLANDYWTRSKEINGTKKTSEKTKLGFRARTKTRVVTLEWYYNRWVYNGKAKKPLSSYIRKGAGPAYRVESILKYAQDWERDIVIEIETQAAAIRRQAVSRVELMNALEKYIDSQT